MSNSEIARATALYLDFLADHRNRNFRAFGRHLLLAAAFCVLAYVEIYFILGGF